MLLELDQCAGDGKVPGLKGIEEIYTDGIHFNNLSRFIVGATFFSTLYRETPQGLPGEPYDKLIDEKTAQAIQQTVWDVVKNHPYASVKTP